MTHDIAIVGAGIFGLTLAREFVGKGKSVILIDAGAIGGDAMNASAGLLGALMPPSPLVTGPLAAVQLRCLSRYKSHIAVLEVETGLATGYRQPGRVQPILTEQASANFMQQQTASANAWQDFPTNAHLRIVSRAELAEQFPIFAPQLADTPYSYAVDGVSAQVTPRLLLAALAQSIEGKVTLQPNTRVLRLDGEHITAAAATYQAKQVVITAGWQTGALVPAAPIIGVKGQACAVSPIMQNAPLLYTRNGYVVFHDAFTALGSTTEKHWTDTEPDRETCTDIKHRAAELLPALANQQITECWAGVRPKAISGTNGALPLIVRVNDHTIVASGGYKVGLALGFGIAQWIDAWLTAARDENAAINTTSDFWNFVSAQENFNFPTMLNMTAA